VDLLPRLGHVDAECDQILQHAERDGNRLLGTEPAQLVIAGVARP
jgi:hypothetical protein